MSTDQDSSAELDALIDQAARSLLEGDRLAMMKHPNVDELVALQEGRLLENRAKEIRKHFSACTECADDFLDLRQFDQPTLKEARLKEGSEQSWELFQQRLEEQARGMISAPARHEAQQMVSPEGHWDPSKTEALSSAAQRKPIFAKPNGAEPFRSRWLDPRWILAASLLFAVSGGLGWTSFLVRSSQESGTSLQAPYPFTLRPDGSSTHRSSVGSQTVAVPKSADVLVPTLLLGDSSHYSSYRTEIRDINKSLVFSGGDLPRHEDGRFVLLIPRSKLPAAPYFLHLFGRNGEGEHLLSVYSFVIRDET